jgi:inner membrane protein
MDIFTHAVAILAILSATGHPLLVPFGVLGAIIIDIDMAYAFIPRRFPSLYLLHHGGFAHSITGATFLSAVAFGAAVFLSSAGLLPAAIPTALLLPGLACVLAGAYLHLFLDYLAAPGLPLLYPVTEKRFGLAMFPMAVYLLITVLGIVTLAVLLGEGISREFAVAYLAIFSGLIVISAGLKWAVQGRTQGRSYATLHPFRWIVIQEENPSWTVTEYHLLRGVLRKWTFEKYREVTPSEVSVYAGLPDVRRHRYFSYLSTAERNGSGITFRDPVRELGLMAYPPWYPSVTLQLGEIPS